MKWSKFPSKPVDASKVIVGPVQVYESNLLKRSRRKVQRAARKRVA